MCAPRLVLSAGHGREAAGGSGAAVWPTAAEATTRKGLLDVTYQLADYALVDAARCKLCAAASQIIRMAAKGVDHRPL